MTAAIEHRQLGKLISLIEDGQPVDATAARAVPDGAAERAHVVGLTGAPGVGKSTTTSALIAYWRARGQSVAVIAVDPSSPITGGALLGDRVRMQRHATDAGVYIRSMASRGRLGGLAAATPRVVDLLKSSGFDIVVVETVGVGQADVDIATTADTTVLVVAPGLGDGVQAAKAGLLEVADVIAVNKGDTQGADDAVHVMRDMVSAESGRAANSWRPVVVRIVATADGGIGELAEAIDKHRDWLRSK